MDEILTENEILTILSIVLPLNLTVLSLLKS
jgi:hypothetical protein